MTSSRRARPITAARLSTNPLSIALAGFALDRRLRTDLACVTPATFRPSRSMRPGQNRCRTTGSSARSAASPSTGKGHIWVIHRPRSLTDDEKGAALTPPRSKCCVSAPPVLEFDADGNLLRSWGGAGEGYEWVGREHGIEVDEKGFVWVGGNADNDNAILKFTLDGKFVMQIGKIAPSKGSATTPPSSASPPRPRSTRTPTKSTSPTATATAASSCSMPPPAPTSGTGAPTASRRTTTSSRPTIRRRRRRSNSPIPCIA